MAIRTFAFIDHGGETTDARGKQHWPYHLRVGMTKAHAWRVLYELLAQLQDAEEPDVTFALLGQLTDEPEDAA